MSDWMGQAVEICGQTKSDLRYVLRSRVVIVPEVERVQHVGPVLQRFGRQILKIKRQERVCVFPEQRREGTDDVAPERTELLSRVREPMGAVGAPDCDHESCA